MTPPQVIPSTEGTQSCRARGPSCLAYSLGRRGDAPASFTRTSARGVPRAAILSFVHFSMLTDPSGRERLIYSGPVAAFVLAVALTPDLLTGDRADPAPPAVAAPGTPAGSGSPTTRRALRPVRGG